MSGCITNFLRAHTLYGWCHGSLGKRNGKSKKFEMYNKKPEVKISGFSDFLLPTSDFIFYAVL